MRKSAVAHYEYSQSPIENTKQTNRQGVMVVIDPQVQAELDICRAATATFSSISLWVS